MSSLNVFGHPVADADEAKVAIREIRQTASKSGASLQATADEYFGKEPMKAKPAAKVRKPRKFKDEE
jgi:hypothetical protein